MGKLKKSDIKHVAKLSNLKISDEEVASFEKDLSNIVSYIENLKEVNTKGVEPTSQTTGLKNVKRKDQVDTSDCLSNKKALSGTDKSSNGYFIVPGIFEERDE